MPPLLGIATLKPTYGRTETSLGDPRSGGPMARWVEDLAPASCVLADGGHQRPEDAAGPPSAILGPSCCAALRLANTRMTGW